MTTERTLMIIKPDAMTRGLVGELIHRCERKGYQIVGMKFMHLTKDLLEEHYAHLKDKPFFPGVLKFMQSAPSLAVVFQGKNVVAAMRAMAGATNAADALPGTFRGDYALSIQQNVVHISEDMDAAKAEVARFFKDDEIFTYDRADIAALYADDERGL